MRNVLMLCYNNWELTKKAIASVLAQDVGCRLTVVDNGSTDETKEELRPFDRIVDVCRLDSNQPVTRVVNEKLERLFRQGAEHVLGIGNDVVLPPKAYSEMLRWPRGFVCLSDGGVSPAPIEHASAVSENTPMSVILVRRWAYDAIVSTYGHFFDEGLVHYASDCDLAVRMVACGIRGVQLDLQYAHVRSATLKNAPPEERRRMEIQADRDREYFTKKWGFAVYSLEYAKIANDPNFRGGYCG